MTSRTRFKDRLILTSKPATVWVHDRADCSGAPIQKRLWSSSSYSAYSGRLEVMQDEVVPSFHARKQRGEVFFNPMSSSFVDISPGSSSGHKARHETWSCSGTPYQYKTEWDLTDHTWLDGWFGNTFVYSSDGKRYPKLPAMPATAGHLSNLIAEASTSCLNNRGRSSSNLYESLAELNKAASLLPDLCKGALNILSKRGAVEKFKAAGGVWLGYRYGLKPIISDIDAVVKGMSKAVGRVRDTSRGSASANFSWSSRTARNYDSCVQDLVSTFSEEVTVRAMSLDEHVASMASNVGFTSKGLITLPWELTPYSFVADWFFNFGDFLGAMVPSFGLNQLCSGVTVKREGSATGTLVFISATSGWTNLIPPQGTQNVSYGSRVRYPGLPAPSIVVKQDFRLDNIVRASDAISLLLQQLRR